MGLWGGRDYSWWTGAGEVLPQTGRRGPGVQSLLGELVGQTAWSGVGSPSMPGQQRERGGPSGGLLQGRDGVCAQPRARAP